MTLGIKIVADTGPEGAKAEIEVYSVDPKTGEEGDHQTVVVEQGSTSDMIYLHDSNAVRIKEIMAPKSDEVAEDESHESTETDVEEDSQEDAATEGTDPEPDASPESEEPTDEG